MVLIGKKAVTFLMCLFFTLVSAILRCGLLEEKVYTKYFRVKSCHKLNTSIIARANLNSFTRCLSFTIEKKGLAFNFSPGSSASSEDDFFFTNCEVLSCPDINNLTDLVNDSRFDYYTLYGNTASINNASCLPSIGVFQVNLVAENYSRAENICRSTGGHLAHILSETRTVGLANIVAKQISDWYKAAYVGLNDIHQEGLFVTSLDQPLNCFKYRAWAPGHPRPQRKLDDCVIIDVDKTWRAVNCAKKLPFICEIYPKPPFWDEYLKFENVTCSDIRNRTMRRKCRKIRKRYKKSQKAIKYNEDFNEDRCEEY